MGGLLDVYKDINKGFVLLRPTGWNQFEAAPGEYDIKWEVRMPWPMNRPRSPAYPVLPVISCLALFRSRLLSCIKQATQHPPHYAQAAPPPPRINFVHRGDSHHLEWFGGTPAGPPPLPPPPQPW